MKRRKMVWVEKYDPVTELHWARWEPVERKTDISFIAFVFGFLSIGALAIYYVVNIIRYFI